MINCLISYISIVLNISHNIARYIESEVVVAESDKYDFISIMICDFVIVCEFDKLLTNIIILRNEDVFVIENIELKNFIVIKLNMFPARCVRREIIKTLSFRVSDYNVQRISRGTFSKDIVYYFGVK